MATAKERGHKDWGYGGVVKRDFKADKSDGEYERNRNHSKRWYTSGQGNRVKKNTRRWCKGIEGRNHTLALYNKYTFWHNYKCINCGKEFWGKINKEEFDFIEKKWDWGNGQ